MRNCQTPGPCHGMLTHGYYGWDWFLWRIELCVSDGLAIELHHNYIRKRKPVVCGDPDIGVSKSVATPGWLKIYVSFVLGHTDSRKIICSHWWSICMYLPFFSLDDSAAPKSKEASIWKWKIAPYPYMFDLRLTDSAVSSPDSLTKMLCVPHVDSSSDLWIPFKSKQPPLLMEEFLHHPVFIKALWRTGILFVASPIF